MKFGLRAAMISDVPRLIGIECSAAQAFLGLPDLAWIADDAVQSQECHKTLIENRTAWVAIDERGSPTGFLNGEVAEGCFHILELAVRLDVQGRGIGRALIDLAGQFAAANELGGLTLTTFRDVPWNGPFYRRLGFDFIENCDLTPRLARILEDEARAGLPAERRCAMKLPRARRAAAGSVLLPYPLPSRCSGGRVAGTSTCGHVHLAKQPGRHSEAAVEGLSTGRPRTFALHVQNELTDLQCRSAGC